MIIVFNLKDCGLANNGGSNTIIKSANTLMDLGHEVYILDNGTNGNTWVKLNAPFINRIENLKRTDAVIATGFKTVGSTVKISKQYGIKFHWIRAWEDWVFKKEHDIIKKVVKQPTIKLVNSVCLKDKLKQYDIESHIIYPGYDFEELYPTYTRSTDNTTPVILGALYREGKHGKRKRTDWIFKTVEQIKKKHNIRLHMFGSEARPKTKLIDFYIQSPNKQQKLEFYNMCNIWLAPTKNEGLHLPPAEAMLTECPVVGTNAQLAGMRDYLLHDKTGVVSKNDIDSFIGWTQKLIEDVELRERLGKRARNKIITIGSRQKNMKTLVELIQRLSEGKTHAK